MGTLHMKLGDNLGDILLEIAQTNISEGNPEKGITTYTDSLCGFTKEYALMLLKNEAVLNVTEDGTSVELNDSENDRKMNEHNIFDWKFIINSRMDDLKERLKYLEFCKQEFFIRYSGDIENYSINEMMSRYFDEEDLESIGTHNLAAKLIAGEDFAWDLSSNGSNIWGNLCDEVIHKDNAEKWKKVLYWTVEYVNTIRTLNTEFIRFMRTYNFLVENGLFDPIPKLAIFLEQVLTVLKGFTDPNKGYYHPMCDEKLNDYKEHLLGDLMSIPQGIEFLQNGILKCNILDGYDAGWLSPNGEFYGGDGEISNMIHMVIAEKIFKGNNIYANRMDKDGVMLYGGVDSPDYWLEKHGWVKTHHEDCYGAFMGHRGEDPTPDYPYAYNPTDIQIKLICDYADKFYGGKFYTEANVFGRDFHPDPHSTYKVRQMDDIQIHKIFKG